MRSYRLGLEAIDTVERLCDQLEDDCAFERKTSLYLASRKSDVSELRKEYDTRKAFGFHVEYLEAKDIASRASFTAPGAILSHGDAQVDPYRLTHRLIHSSEKTRITSLRPFRSIQSGTLKRRRRPACESRFSNQKSPSRVCDRLRVAAIPETERRRP